MNELLTKIEQLEDEGYRDYVFARSEVSKDSEAIRNSGISRTRFYGWGKETREYLNKLAIELKTQTALKAKLLLSGATEHAAEVKIKGLTSRKENISQSAATEILDRMLGKPTQNIDQKTEHSGEITLSADEWREEREKRIKKANDVMGK